MDILELIISSISTTYCPACRSPHKSICERCANNIKELSLQNCIICGRYTSQGITHKICSSPTSPSSCTAIYEYTGTVKTVILNCKKHKTPKDLNPLINAPIFSEIARHLRPNINLITYVPDGFISPGFRFQNPPALVAKKISLITKVPLQEIIIKKTFAKKQKGLNREARKKNAAQSYLIPPSSISQIRGKRILLVDDVCTTGATFLALSKAILELGATSIDCIALSKDVLD